MSGPPTPTQSFHLPDLLDVISTLQLRTNSHCKSASQSAEKRVLEHGVLSKREVDLIGPSKIGLLVALCFPTCDRPQLTLLCEAGLWLLVAGMRCVEAKSSVEEDEKSMEGLNGLELLTRHELLQQLHNDSLLHDPRLSRIVSGTCSSWRDRFTRSVLSYYEAQHRSVNPSTDGHISTMENYLSHHRELYGTSLLFDMAELLEVFTFPELSQHSQREKLQRMKESAFNVVSWSMDVVSYHTSHTPYHFNLVTIVMTNNHLSIQGAMNLAGSMIKDAFSSFCILEQDLLNSMQTTPSLLSSLSSFFLSRCGEDASPSSRSPSLRPDRSSDASQFRTRLEEVSRYIQALKDCMAGCIHWVFETEMFFGKKGGEVRTFGWVFPNMKYAETLESPVGEEFSQL